MKFKTMYKCFQASKGKGKRKENKSKPPATSLFMSCNCFQFVFLSKIVYFFLQDSSCITANFLNVFA